METNEQGLTREEKVMFSILGIILIIAIGVLIINSLSSTERKADNTKTPITETQGNKEDKVEDETNTESQKENLIEEKPLENVASNNAVSTKPSRLNQTTTQSKPVVDTNVSTPVPGIIEWDFKDSIITETYSNTKITIDRNVVLKNGKEVEAVLTIRKLEGNSWNIVDISSNEIVVTEGLYKYYYTYGNQTKELLLTVKSELTIEQLTILSLVENYTENLTIKEEDFNKYKTIIAASTLIREETNTLKINKVENLPHIIPIVLTITEELDDPVIYSSTLGVLPSTEQNDLYQNLTNKDIILWLDLSLLDLTNPEINININGQSYYFNLIIEYVTNDSGPSEGENPDTETDTNEQEPDSEGEQPSDETNGEQEPEEGEKPANDEEKDENMKDENPDNEEGTNNGDSTLEQSTDESQNTTPDNPNINNGPIELNNIQQNSENNEIIVP